MVRPDRLHSKTVLLYLLPAWQANLDGILFLIWQYDIKNHKIFLKKIAYPDISVDDLFIGNVIMCYNRQLKVVEFAD